MSSISELVWWYGKFNHFKIDIDCQTYYIKMMTGKDIETQFPFINKKQFFTEITTSIDVPLYAQFEDEDLCVYDLRTISYADGNPIINSKHACKTIYRKVVEKIMEKIYIFNTKSSQLIYENKKMQLENKLIKLI